MFAQWLPRTHKRPDTHLVKERITYTDGTHDRKIRLLHDFKRSYYITKKFYQNHQQKKEDESIDRLEKYTCTQSELTKHIHERLGMFCPPIYRRLATSPYLYGSDVSAASIIKHGYTMADRKRGNAQSSKFTVATFDLETDIVWGTEEILINNVCSNGVVELGILSKFLKGIDKPLEKLEVALQKYLGDELNGREVIFKIYDKEIDVIRKPIERAHADRPDFLTCWGLNFDVPYIEKRCKALGEDVAMVWKDPALPDKYAYYKYNKGQEQITSDSGSFNSLAPSAQWHSVETAASFTTICSMTTRRQLRAHKPEAPSYSLDYTMSVELGKTKLKFTEADHLSHGAWHHFMQSKYPIEYCIYAVWDSLGLKDLCDKTKDLAVSLPIGMDYSEFSQVKRKTRRTDDNYYFGNLPNNIAATLGTTKAEEAETEEVYPISGWIITAPAYKQVPGRKILSDYCDMPTGIRLINFYLDITSAYPSGGIVTNLCKATTRREICHVRGCAGGDDVFRYQFMNDFSGAVNSQQFSRIVFGLPSVDTVMDRIAEKLTM